MGKEVTGMDIPKGLELIKKLREGKTVVCHKCGKGIIHAIGDCKTTKVYYCDKCDYRLTLD